MKPPSPLTQMTTRSGLASLTPQSGHEAKPEVVLISTTDVGAWYIHGQCIARGKSDLTDLLNEESIARQGFTNNIQISDLRLEIKSSDSTSANDVLYLQKAPSFSAGAARCGL